MENTKQKNTTGTSKEFAKLVRDTFVYDSMDANNKKALDVMATKGAESAVKHMFTDQESGRPLSYAEMRMRYG